MPKNPLKPIETWSTPTYELHTPEYTIRMRHQWRRAMETDVDNCDLLEEKMCPVLAIHEASQFTFSCFSFSHTF